jgi:hypothetical protein
LVTGLGLGSDGLTAALGFSLGFGVGSFADGCAGVGDESLSGAELASGFSGAELSLALVEAASGFDAAGAESVEPGGVVAAGFEFEAVASDAGELETGAS